MSFWSTARRVTMYVATLGGSERLRTATEDWKEVRGVYDRIRREANALSEQLEPMLRALGSQAEIAFNRLLKAERILAPLKKQNLGTRMNGSLAPALPVLSTANQCKEVIQRFVAFKATTTGTAAGTALGVGSWTAVSLLGSASTGTGIATLSGIAGTNATLAWFGGGSLATGGLGMAGGGMVLGGLVVVPIIGISAWHTHSKAAKIERSVKDHELANEKNRAVVKALKAAVSEVPLLVPRFQCSVEHLTNEITRVQRILFKFGWLSRVYRSIRCYFKGYYYTAADMLEVEALAKSVEQFVLQFETEKKLLATKT